MRKFETRQYRHLLSTPTCLQQSVLATKQVYKCEANKYIQEYIYYKRKCHKNTT